MTGDVRRVAFAGDWHANAAYGAAAIAYAKDRGADVIVHTGDYGYLYPPSFIAAIDDALRRAGLELRFVEGNHDNPAALAGLLEPDGLRRVGVRQWHIPRGYRWTWAGKTFLGCGGAVSVDRPWRTPGVSWWPEETITDEDVRRCVAGGPVDVLVAHDCPAGIVIPGVDDRAGPPAFPALEIQRSNEHRQMVRQIVDGCRPSLIVHGHYHVAYETDQHLMRYPALVVGLDCDGSDLDRNVRVVDLEHLPEPA